MTRQRSTIPLEVIQIATPCHASWDEMRGNDRVRFCDECKLHVYNISAMSREAASELVAQREGRLCVQMYRRADGTVITDDCGAIRKAARRSLQFAGTAASVVLCAAISPLFLLASDRTPTRNAHASFVPLATFDSWFAPIMRLFRANTVRGEMSYPVAGGISAPTSQPTMGVPIMGDVAMPPPPTTQPAQQLMGKVSLTTRPAADELDHAR
jgi:hypothetical protein